MDREFHTSVNFLLYNAFLFRNSISFRQIVSRIIVKQRRQEVISRNNAACSCQKRIPKMQMNLNGDHQRPNFFDLPRELQFSRERLRPRGNSICTSDFTGYRHESGSILSNRPISWESRRYDKVALITYTLRRSIYSSRYGERLHWTGLDAKIQYSRSLERQGTFHIEIFLLHNLQMFITFENLLLKKAV